MTGHPRPRPRRIPLTAEDRANAPRLKASHRNVLLAEGSDAEIAASAGLPIGTVKSRLHRARAAAARLRKQESPAEAQP